MLDIFFLPDITSNPTEASIVLAGIFGTLVLLLFGAGASLHAPIVRDNPKEGILIPCYYTFTFYVKTLQLNNKEEMI